MTAAPQPTASPGAMPLVSFIVPAYNVASYIEQAVDSALHQTYPHVEVVIVDDGSTDHTAAVIQGRYGTDARVRCFRQTNAGPSAARNHALREARGEFVHFLDADEFISPTKVERSYALFRQQPDISVVYGHGIPVLPDGVTELPMTYPPLPSGWIFCDWLTGTMSGGTYGVTSSFMVRREAVLAVGGFDESTRHAEDWDLWLRLAARYPFAALPDRLVYYRRTLDGLHTHRLSMALGRLHGYQRAKHYVGRENCLDDAAYNRLLASRWHVVAERYWEANRRHEARQAFHEAIKLADRPTRRVLALLTWIAPYRVVKYLLQIKSRRQ